MALWPGRRCFHTRGFVIAALKPGILAAGLVAGVWGTEGTRSPKRAASPPASSFIFVFGRGCEIFDWLAGWIACPPVAICIVTYYLLPLEKDKWKLLVRVFFFLFSSAIEFTDGVIKIRITRLEVQIVVVVSQPPPILLSAVLELILIHLFLRFLPHL